jgi:hypothetical protein
MHIHKEIDMKFATCLAFTFLACFSLPATAEKGGSAIKYDKEKTEKRWDSVAPSPASSAPAVDRRENRK